LSALEDGSLVLVLAPELAPIAFGRWAEDLLAVREERLRTATL
jgi:hypothetical protein